MGRGPSDMNTGKFHPWWRRFVLLRKVLTNSFRCIHPRKDAILGCQMISFFASARPNGIGATPEILYLKNRVRVSRGKDSGSDSLAPRVVLRNQAFGEASHRHP